MAREEIGKNNTREHLRYYPNTVKSSDIIQQKKRI